MGFSQEGPTAGGGPLGNPPLGDLDMPATPPRGASETSLLPLCPGQQGMWQGKSAWMSVSQDEGAGAPPHRHTHELPPPGDGLRPSTHIPSGPSPREEL